ncbi:MAG: DUF11 domain-containing protein [Anaerolineae bacterium]|nr:DUF11 domain-containing protein [Anaerolineae bacterium]
MMWKKLFFLFFLFVGCFYGSAEAVRQAGSANLAVSVTDSPDPVIVSTPYTYTIVVSNSGPDAATGVVLDIDFPLGMIFQSAAPGCTWDEPTRHITCAIGSLNLNATSTVTVNGIPVISGSLFAAVSVSGTQPDPNPANNTETEKTIINPPVGTRVVYFANQSWYVKAGTNMGPANNNWSDSSESVWVDAQGRLHLKIRKIGDTWWCAEVFTMMTYGYGTYQFFVDSDLNAVDQNIVLGLFLYQDDQNELDVEVSRWGVPADPNAQFVIQPYYVANHRERFFLNNSGPTVHEMVWKPDSVLFTSFQGSSPVGSPVIHTWEHAHTDIPQQERDLRLHFNLWLLNPPQMPANEQAFEVILSTMKFAPLPATPSLSFPANGSSNTVLQPTLFWQYAPNAVKYEVQIGQGNPPAAAPISVSSTVYTLPSPLAPGTYYWRVRSISNLNIISEWSNTWSFTITSLAGGAPTRNYFTTSTATLTWYGVTWATGYEIQVDNSPAFATPEYSNNTLAGSASSVTTSTLADGLYYWRIRAKKPDGTWGMWSVTDTFTIAGG